MSSVTRYLRDHGLVSDDDDVIGLGECRQVGEPAHPTRNPAARVSKATETFHAVAAGGDEWCREAFRFLGP